MGLIAYFANQASNARIAGFRDLARRLGLTYAPTDQDLISLPLPLLSAGDESRRSSGTFGGCDLTASDFAYEEHSTDAEGRRTTSTFTFECVTTRYDASGPRLRIAEENVLTRLADAVGMDDLRFESERFNEAFNVKSNDPRFATAFVDARMIEWLLAHGRGCAFEVAGDRILVAHRRMDVEAIPTLLGTVAAFVAQIPRVVASLYPKSG
jgi:hypothetical protein